MARKRWIKLWTQETLYGTTNRELEPAERAVWFGFLALSGDSVEPGKVEVAPNIPFTNEQLVKLLNVPMDILLSAKDKMIQCHKITTNGDIITINNWETYQSNYERTKIYPRKSTTKSTTSKVVEKPVENLHQKLTTTPEQSRAEGTRAEQNRSKEEEKKKKREVNLSTAQQYLFDILLECPTIKKSDAYKLPDLMEDYPNLNYKLEFKKFVEWWSKRKLKSPWLALRNWLEKASKIEPSTEEEEVVQEWDKRQEEYLKGNSAE